MASGKCCWFLSLSLIRFAPMSQICWVLCHWHFCAIRQISCRIICFIYNVTYELSASSAFTILMTSTFDGPHWGLTPMWSNQKRLEKLLKRNDLLFIWKNTQNTGTQAECRSYHTASGRACSYETVSACDRGRRAIYQWIQYCVRCGINCSSRWRRWRIQSPLQ